MQVGGCLQGQAAAIITREHSLEKIVVGRRGSVCSHDVQGRQVLEQLQCTGKFGGRTSETRSQPCSGAGSVLNAT